MGRGGDSCASGNHVPWEGSPSSAGCSRAALGAAAAPRVRVTELQTQVPRSAANYQAGRAECILELL